MMSVIKHRLAKKNRSVDRIKQFLTVTLNEVSHVTQIDQTRLSHVISTTEQDQVRTEAFHTQHPHHPAHRNHVSSND